MDDLLTRMARDGLLRNAGVGNDSPDGPRQAARMQGEERWGNHLLQLRNDVRETLRRTSRELANSWNGRAAEMGPRVDAEAMPSASAYALAHGLDEGFVDDFRYTVMTVAMAASFGLDATVPGIAPIADALLAGRLPCGIRGGRLVSY